MAKEPRVYGHRKEAAFTLARIAAREGLKSRTGSKHKYPQPIPGGGNRIWLGKADAAIASDASGTVSIWTGSPPTDSGDNLEDCLNWTGIDIDSGGRVEVKEISGYRFVFPLECPA